MGDTFNDLEQILELVREEVRNAIEEYKKTNPQFRKQIEELFSFNIDFEKSTSKLIQLIMDYAERPHQALPIIPSIMATTQDLVTTQKNYERAKKFPHLFPYNLAALRNQYLQLKQLWNKKIWILIVRARLSTKIQRSIWSALEKLNNQFAFVGDESL